MNLDAGEADAPAAEGAWRMFRPWTEEKQFKSSWIEFALDGLVDDSVELDDQEHLAVNPR